MSTVGIIAEYNPFHKGHRYQIEQAKKITGADYCVAVMSPNFVQRGEPAVFHKSLRTKAALMNGCDLVLSLPVCFATSSAEIFATAAVSILLKAHVDSICFGSECGDIDRLSKLAEFFLLAESDSSYQETLSNNLHAGLPYARSRQQAFLSYVIYAPDTPFLAGDIPVIEHIMEQPNNILAIEYIKAIYRLGGRGKLIPYTVRRFGAPYKETKTMEIASAMAIRSAIHDGGDYFSMIPENCADLIRRSVGTSVPALPLLPNDFSILLNEAIFCRDSYEQFADVGEELSNKIRNNKDKFYSFEDWVKCLTSKTYPASRVRRALLHILLDLRVSDFGSLHISSDFSTPYTRICGINPDRPASFLKNEEESDSPFILSRASLGKKLSDDGAVLFAKEKAAEDLYRAAFYYKYQIYLPKETELNIVR